MLSGKTRKIRYRWSYRVPQLLIRVAARLLFGARYVYKEPIPENAPLIVASNHVSYFDPPLVGAGIPRELFYMAKRELFRNPLFRALISYYNSVPVRRGVMDWTAVSTLKDILARGGAMLLFPEGTRSRDGVLGKPKFGVGMLAQESRAVILPVYARGAGSLKDAFMRRKTIRVCYGRPISPEEYADFELSPRGQIRIAEMVMERIAALQRECEGPDSSRDRGEGGIYAPGNGEDIDIKRESI